MANVVRRIFLFLFVYLVCAQRSTDKCVTELLVTRAESRLSPCAPLSEDKRKLRARPPATRLVERRRATRNRMIERVLMV